jgi:UDP-N-acetylmuramoyl-L-alanyl-D-glutamate--2,6-diaminopimelate ligase
MEEYLAAKKLIFKKLKSQAQLFVPMEQTDLQALIKDCDYKLAKSFDSYDLTNNNNIFEIQFNRENFSVAYEIVNSISPINNPIDLSKIEEVPGRFNILEKNELKVVIDSAHTPDALENVCKAIQKNYPNKEIRAVFGCGGDRDKDKRPKMAQILKKYCDYLYITSDNPRYEDPDLIIDDIVVNLELNEYYRNRDRTKAITYAIDEFKSGVLLIAGKGHEDYIIIKEEYTPYSDFEAVKNCFKKW